MHDTDAKSEVDWQIMPTLITIGSLLVAKADV